MTTEHEASRTLVKSPPELWAECSEAASLARHLDQFGEIRITRLEPETAVAWEGEDVSGTVRLEPSGWGTKVIMTAVSDAVDETEAAPVVEAPPPEPAIVEAPPEPVAAEPPPEPAIVEATEPDSEPYPLPPAAEAPASKPGLWARLTRMFTGEPPAPIELAQPPEPAAPPAPVARPEPAAVAPSPELEPQREKPTEPETPVEPEPEPHATEVALAAALESLGQAHHRPFSRA
jgi:hypothetical protein